MINQSEWKDRVDLRIYHLDEDPTPGEKYQPITWATVVINGKIRLDNLTTHSFFDALEKAAKEANMKSPDQNSIV